MKKQFYRVKQLADQTFNRGEKSEILNHEELQIADQKVEYLRLALLAISKRIGPNYPVGDIEKLMKKTLEYQLGNTFLEESKQQRECPLFQLILKESGTVEQWLARDYADYEQKVEELVFTPFHQVVENELPNIMKLKHNLKKYCLDKDSASNRYHATGKETVREDMEEADTKVEQSRDALATEMFNILARENEFSEYILQFLKLQRIYHESALKSLQNLIPQLEKKIGDSPVRKVFGTSLSEHLRITGKRIAYPLEICITALSEDGLSEEGLFRVAASTIKVKRLKASIDSGCFSHLIPEYKDVHILASLLKLYLRELPEPLLTFHLHKEWIDAAQVSESKRLDAVRDIIGKLPQENRDNLAYLFQFLSKLIKYPENKMTASNIAIVLSPNLLWNKNENLNVNIGNCVTINVVVELLIKEADLLFPDDASKYVTLDILHYEDHVNSFKTSNSNLSSSADSPRPNQRKKKSAPIPPGKISQENHSKPHITIERQTVQEKQPQLPETKTEKEQTSPKAIPKPPGAITPPKPKPDAAGQKPPIVVKPESISPVRPPPVVTKVDRVTMTEMPPQQNKFTTTAVHKVTQTIVESKNEKNTSMSNKPRVNSDNIDDVQIRRKDPSMKPEVPARPSSLSVRPPSVDNVDPMLRRTQCSVYNVANRQQPSIINIQSKNEVFQPGHDNLISEKEKFLGHKPEVVVKDNNFNSTMNAVQRRLSDAGKQHNISGPVSLDTAEKPKPKSTEELNVKQPDCDTNSNSNNTQKSSHTRARSDGGMIDVSSVDGRSFHPSKSLSKPTEPPPPPPEL